MNDQGFSATATFAIRRASASGSTGLPTCPLYPAAIARSRSTLLASAETAIAWSDPPVGHCVPARESGESASTRPRRAFADRRAAHPVGATEWRRAPRRLITSLLNTESLMGGRTKPTSSRPSCRAESCAGTDMVLSSISISAWAALASSVRNAEFEGAPAFADPFRTRRIQPQREIASVPSKEPKASKPRLPSTLHSHWPRVLQQATLYCKVTAWVRCGLEERSV
jgi:hypothetical protein